MGMMNLDLDLELIHDEPEWPWTTREKGGYDLEYSPDGEYLYRLFTPLDDSRGELIDREARCLAAKATWPYKEARWFILKCMAAGFPAATWRYYWRQGQENGEGVISLFNLEELVDQFLQEEFKFWWEGEKYVPLPPNLSGEENEEEENVLPSLPLEEEEVPEDFVLGDKDLVNFVVNQVWRNFTGEVRIPVLPQDPSEEEISCSPLSKEEEKLIDNISRLIKSVVTAKSGRYAYKFSQEAQHLMGKLKDEEKRTALRKALHRAWEIRRSNPPDPIQAIKNFPW